MGNHLARADFHALQHMTKGLIILYTLYYMPLFLCSKGNKTQLLFFQIRIFIKKSLTTEKHKEQKNTVIKK